MTFLIVFLTSFYCLVILSFLLGIIVLIRKHKKQHPSENNHLKITIAIPARNEEEHIENCVRSILSKANLPHIHQIIILNDDSTDKTQNILERLALEFPLIKVIQVKRDSGENHSPKKKLIQIAVKESQTDWIALTDADCIISHNWLEGMKNYITNESAMICGPVEFIEEKNWFSVWQKIEFSGLMLASAGSIGIGRPTTCNAANLLIRKSMFETVNGFDGVSHIVSGDDEFLMHKFYAQNPKSVSYAFEKKTVVNTYSHKNFQDFFNQRKRWASKGLLYKSIPYRLFLIVIWFYHFLILSSVLYSFFNTDFAFYFIVCMIAKTSIDTFLILKANYFLSKPNSVFSAVWAQTIQIPYIVFAGFLGTFGSFTWKGVRYK